MTDVENKIAVTAYLADTQVEGMLIKRHGRNINDNLVVGSFAPYGYREPLNSVFIPMSVSRTLELSSRDYTSDNRYVLVGTSFGGDSVNTPCDFEHDELAYQFSQLESGIRPSMTTPGNHCGGGWLGYIHDYNNRMATPPFTMKIKHIYPQVIEDGVMACGERQDFTEKNESTDRLFDLTHYATNQSVTDVTKEMSLEDWRAGLAYSTQWYLGETVTQKPLWDVYFSIVRPEKEQRRIEKRIEKGKMTDDVRSGVALQAMEKASFQTEYSDQPFRVIQVSVNTEDFTDASLKDSMEKGRVSAAGIQAILGFMDRRLEENPNTAFQLLMHFTPEEMTNESQEALKKLFERDQVLTVYSAHVHASGVADLTETMNLDRETQLPIIWIPSPADRSTLPERGFDNYAEMFWEEMEWVADSDGGHLEIRIKPVRLTEDMLPHVEMAQARLNQFEKEFGFTRIDEAMAALNPDLQGIVERKNNWDLLWRLIKIKFKPGSVPDYLKLNATLEKLLVDAELISEFIHGVILPLLYEEAQTISDFDCHDDPNVSLNRCDPEIERYEEELFQYAENLTRYVEWLDARWLVWNSRLEKLQEMKNASKALEIWQEEQITLEAKDKERGFDMNEFSNLLNTLPENSAAQTASLLARMQAVEEEFAYKTDSQMKEYVRNMPQRIDPYAVAVNFELSDERVVAKHIAVNFDPDVANVNIASSHEYE